MCRRCAWRRRWPSATRTPGEQSARRRRGQDPPPIAPPAERGVRRRHLLPSPARDGAAAERAVARASTRACRRHRRAPRPPPVYEQRTRARAARAQAAARPQRSAAPSAPSRHQSAALRSTCRPAARCEARRHRRSPRAARAVAAWSAASSSARARRRARRRRAAAPQFRAARGRRARALLQLLVLAPQRRRVLLLRARERRVPARQARAAVGAVHNCGRLGAVALRLLDHELRGAQLLLGGPERLLVVELRVHGGARGDGEWRTVIHREQQREGAPQPPKSGGFGSAIPIGSLRPPRRRISRAPRVFSVATPAQWLRALR